MEKVSFSIPFTCEESADNVRKLIEDPQKVNSGFYTQKCVELLEAKYQGYKAYLTTSCTRSLELIALGLNLQPQDEVILSPFTYVGVGNAFANYGANLVFVDIRPETMNINADLIEAAITPKTKAIIAMHYASIGCEMEKIVDLCNHHNIALIEDNAQGTEATYHGQLLGTFGDFSCLSFDILKNISCNEGGALLLKEPFIDAFDIVYENGTNRTAFRKGKVDSYEWVDRGSKFSMSEYTAAVLYPLLIKSESINKTRRKKWDDLLSRINREESLSKYIPRAMFDYDHNGHIAYLKFESTEQRNLVMKYLNDHGIQSSFHYVSLDLSIAGQKHIHPNNFFAAQESNRLLRLPMHNYLTEDEMDRITSTLIHSLKLSYI